MGSNKAGEVNVAQLEALHLRCNDRNGNYVVDADEEVFGAYDIPLYLPANKDQYLENKQCIKLGDTFESFSAAHFGNFKQRINELAFTGSVRFDVDGISKTVQYDKGELSKYSVRELAGCYNSLGAFLLDVVSSANFYFKNGAFFEGYVVSNVTDGSITNVGSSTKRLTEQDINRYK